MSSKTFPVSPKEKFCDCGYVPQYNFAYQNSSATAEQNTKFQHQLISIEDHVIIMWSRIKFD